jgi:hypothetical protein
MLLIGLEAAQAPSRFNGNAAFKVTQGSFDTCGDS